MALVERVILGQMPAGLGQLEDGLEERITFQFGGSELNQTPPVRLSFCNLHRLLTQNQTTEPLSATVSDAPREPAINLRR